MNENRIMFVRRVVGQSLILCACLGILLVLAGTASADSITYNTYPGVGGNPADPNLVVISPRVESGPGDDVGISYSGTGLVEVYWTQAASMVVDSLWFQVDDWGTNGRFQARVLVAGVEAVPWMVFGSGTSDSPAAPGGYILTDVKWDFATDFSVTAGQQVRIIFDHLQSMSGSGSTAARLRHVADSVAPYAAVKGVFGETGGYTPMALLPPGSSQLPNLTASPASGTTLAFGSVANGAAATCGTPIVLTNDGSAGSTLDLTGANFTGPNAGLFQLVETFVNPTTLTAGGPTASATYHVQFLGTTTAGSYSAHLAFPNSITGDVGYDLTATVAVGPHMGDANRDGKVDLQDFSLLKAYYSLTGQPWSHGNFNNDANGLVNLEDFSLLKAHYNHTGDAGNVPLTAVPEPATMALLLVGLAGLVRRRR